MRYGYYPPYVSVAQKKAKAARKLKELRKKIPDIQPIVIPGRTLAKTWWGKSWNVNLERYADYSNRIGRGRSYVRHGAVLDLRIDAGRVTSLVQGTDSSPYKVEIRIDGIDKTIWQNMIEACAGKLDSMPELLSGKLPRGLGKIFTTQGKGLFPSPAEIRFNCSCPDWASMCKHVAATLYGVGARLDEDPLLFFKLREVDVNDLISRTVKDARKKLLEKAETAKADTIEESDVSALFDIDFDDSAGMGAVGAAAPDSVSANPASYEPGVVEATPAETKKKSKSDAAGKKAEAGATVPKKAARGAKRKKTTKRTKPPAAAKTNASKKTAAPAPAPRTPKKTPRPISKKEGREVSVDAMVRHFLQRFDLPTRRDLKKLDERMSRLEELVASTDFGGPASDVSDVRTDEPGKKTARSAPSPPSPGKETDEEMILRIIRSAGREIGVPEIRSDCDLKTHRIRYIILKLRKDGEIRRVARGRFIAL